MSHKITLSDICPGSQSVAGVGLLEWRPGSPACNIAVEVDSSLRAAKTGLSDEGLEEWLFVLENPLDHWVFL